MATLLLSEGEKAAVERHRALKDDPPLKRDPPVVADFKALVLVEARLVGAFVDPEDTKIGVKLWTEACSEWCAIGALTKHFSMHIKEEVRKLKNACLEFPCPAKAQGEVRKRGDMSKRLGSLGDRSIMLNELVGDVSSAMEDGFKSRIDTTDLVQAENRKVQIMQVELDLSARQA